MNTRVNARAKACDIPAKVKAEVWERDHHRCVICADPNAMPNSHFISRAKGGLGIPENIVTLCRACHFEFDNGVDHEYYRERIEKYLKKMYPDWNREKVVFKNRWINGESYEASSPKNTTP